MPSNFCEFSNREQTVYAVTRAPMRAPRGPRGPETARSGNRKRQTLKRQSPGYCGSRDSVVTGAIRRGPHTTNYPVPRLPSDTARLPRRLRLAAGRAYATVPAVTSDGTTVHDGYPPGPTGERTAVSGPFTPHLLDVQVS